jgi:hypothetical protein
MFRALQLEIPVRDKICLAILSCYGDRDGTRIEGSIPNMAAAAGVSESTLYRRIRVYKKAGILQVQGASKGGRGKTTSYKITLPAANPVSTTGFSITETLSGRARRSTQTLSPTSRNPVTVTPDPKSFTKSKDKRPTAVEEAASPQVPKGSPKKKTWHQKRFANIDRLAWRALEIMENAPHVNEGVLADLLKVFAAQNDIEYFDGLRGAASPIDQAIIIARKRFSEKRAAVQAEHKKPPARAANREEHAQRKKAAAG